MINDLKRCCFSVIIFNECYFHQLEMISVIKLNGGIALFGMHGVNVLALMPFCLSSVGNCSNFALILLNLS